MHNYLIIFFGGKFLIKYAITVGGLIAVFIVAFYVFGLEPTKLELTEGNNFHDKDFTKVNQSGKTEPYATVTINGENVAVDKDGNFYKVIEIQNGHNIIFVDAKAPFKSATQLNTTVNKTEDKNGVSAEWSMDVAPQITY